MQYSIVCDIECHYQGEMYKISMKKCNVSGLNNDSVVLLKYCIDTKSQDPYNNVYYESVDDKELVEKLLNMIGD
jgi:hypothetical protein